MDASIDPIIRDMTGWEIFIARGRRAFTQLRRRLPYLVWYGDELDVGVTLSQDKLRPDDPLGSLFGGSFADIERQLSAAGITFDKGIGCDGRDWEWDWSLQGPISIQFRGRAQHPKRRMERPRPKLVVSNAP